MATISAIESRARAEAMVLTGPTGHVLPAALVWYIIQIWRQVHLMVGPYSIGRHFRVWRRAAAVFEPFHADETITPCPRRRGSRNPG